MEARGTKSSGPSMLGASEWLVAPSESGQTSGPPPPSPVFPVRVPRKGVNGKIEENSGEKEGNGKEKMAVEVSDLGRSTELDTPFLPPRVNCTVYSMFCQ